MSLRALRHAVADRESRRRVGGTFDGVGLLRIEHERASLSDAKATVDVVGKLIVPTGDRRTVWFRAASKP